MSVAPEAAFDAIAHPIRRALLDRLREGERTVNDLARPFDVSRPAISQHLRILRDAGLVMEIGFPASLKPCGRMTAG